MGDGCFRQYDRGANFPRDLCLPNPASADSQAQLKLVDNDGAVAQSAPFQVLTSCTCTPSCHRRRTKLMALHSGYKLSVVLQSHKSNVMYVKRLIFV